METPKIFESEYRFCLLLWEHEPVNSTKLAALCKEQLGWSKATTYTVIRRLGERGVLKNENATVTALLSREEAQTSRVESWWSRPSAAASPPLSPPLAAAASCPGRMRPSSGP